MNEEIKKSNSYLSFKIGDSSFCINVNKVLNILELTKITIVPQSPDYMLGVINLRGEVLPVVDARIKFGIPKQENTINTCIIVLDIEFEKEMAHIGLLVDSVIEVFEIDDEALLPPPGIGSKYKSDFIKGIFKTENEFIMQLNIDKVFTSDELLIVNDSGANFNNNNINPTNK